MGVKLFAAVKSTIQYATVQYRKLKILYKMAYIDQIISFYISCFQDLFLKGNVTAVVLKHIR
jgi:hypothetical protein